MKTKLLGIIFVIFALPNARADSPLTIDVREDRGEVEIRYKQQRLFLYACGTNQFKPYVRELYTMRGENILRDAPFDHLHHHGLMYAVWVNGINFWEEREAAGIEKSVQVLAYVTGSNGRGLPQAQFIQAIHWLASTNKAAEDSLTEALVLEQRKLTLMVDEKNEEVALRWEADFGVGPKAGKVKWHGPNYDGLGMRFPQSVDHIAKFENSSGAAYTASNTQNVITGKWTSIAGKIGDRQMMAVMFGLPSNPGGEAKFFTMTEPFSYLSATQGLDKAPLEYSPGEKFHLSYLVLIYAEPKSRDFIQERYQTWEKNKS